MTKVRKIIVFCFMILGLSMFLFGLLHDIVRYGSVSYGNKDRFVIFCGVVFVFLSIVCLLIDGLSNDNRFKKIANRLFSYEFSFLISGIFAILVYGFVVFSNSPSFAPEGGVWAIGIYESHSDDPLGFTNFSLANPVITADAVTDRNAEFVADPFLFNRNNTNYLFFELFNADTKRGEIAYCESEDGRNWDYKGVVISEDFHMSYPYVFKFEDKVYMIPQTATNSVKLYEALEFPLKWKEVRTLLDGSAYVDSSIFQHQGIWWLMTYSSNDSTLRMFYSDNLFGKWVEHPKSPITNDQNIARPGGRIMLMGDKLVRFAQDVSPYYGNQVWALEITSLSVELYEEKIIGGKPVLKGFDNWNTRGMHTLSPIYFNGHWIAAVDGY